MALWPSCRWRLFARGRRSHKSAGQREEGGKNQMKPAQEWLKGRCVPEDEWISAIQLDARDGMVEESKLAAAEQRVKELERELADANHWRKRHCKDAILYGNRSQENWERAHAAIEREQVLRQAMETILRQAPFHSSVAGWLPPIIKDALAATGKEEKQ